MPDKLVIGVDIGGTRTKYGLVNLATGKVLSTLIKPTETEDAAVFLEQVGHAIESFWELAAQSGDSVHGIGIGVPGFVDEEGMVATTYGFLDFMENYPLKETIETMFGIPCRLDNDARVVALGEALYGKGKNYKRVVTLTLGTGLGFGFVVNGVFTESLPLAHMGGHMQILDVGPTCYCGKTGCLEALVSAGGISHLAQQSMEFVEDYSAETVFNSAAKGIPAALQIVYKVCGYLHTGIHNYVNLFAPDIVVLGGGIAKGLARYLDAIKGTSYLSPYPGFNFQIAVSELEELAGMLGSAALFHQPQNTIA